jgi:hypothetical protein
MKLSELGERLFREKEEFCLIMWMYESLWFDYRELNDYYNWEKYKYLYRSAEDYLIRNGNYLVIYENERLYVGKNVLDYC